MSNPSGSITSAVANLEVIPAVGTVPVSRWPGFVRDNAYAVEVVGDLAYVAITGGGVIILDLLDPTNPALVGQYNTPGSAEGIAVAGHYAYIAERTSGLLVLDVSNPEQPTLVGQLDTTGQALDVQVVGPYAYGADGPAGLRVIDVSHPAAAKSASNPLLIINLL